MMKRSALFALIALAVLAPLSAKNNDVSVRIGAEATFADNFNQIGAGPLIDFNVAINKNFDFEAYLLWTPFFTPEVVAGSLYGELDLYYHIALKNKVSLHPAICVSDYMWLDPMLNVVLVEPSLKLDVKNVFVKLCVPLVVVPEFTPTAYVEPGIHLNQFTVKLRASAVLDPMAFQYLRWWADYAFGKNDIYAYGEISGFGEDQEISYNQYIGFYIGL